MKVILFDGICNLCNGFVNFIIDRDEHAVFKFATLQSDYAKELLTKLREENQGLNTVFLYDGIKIYKKSEAVLLIAEQLPKYNWVKIFKILPKVLLDFFYNLIAKNRYRFFGKRTSCRIPTKELAARFITD